MTDALAQIDPTTLDRRELLDLLVVLSTTATRVAAELARRGDTDDDLIPVSTAARRLGHKSHEVFRRCRIVDLRSMRGAAEVLSGSRPARGRRRT